MFFGDKYGDIVRVVKMDESFSQEFCGGTHVKNTSEIGLFKIISESSIAAGARRIEAITGKSIEEYINNTQDKIAGKQSEIVQLHDKIKQLEKEVSSYKMGDIKTQMQEWITHAKIINGIRIISQKIDSEDLEQLRQIGENLRDELGKQGIGLIASILNEKVQLVCVVTDDLMKKYPAGKIVGEAAKQIGGAGGGKPHLATAGGKDISKLPHLLNNFHSLIVKLINI